MSSDQEFNIQFVGKVEKREVLYNYYLPEYSRKDITEKAWQEVADEVKLCVTECKEKWRNLRTVFIRKMKPSPIGSTRRKKAYYLADAMQFCVPFIKVLDSFPNSRFKHETSENISFKSEHFETSENISLKSEHFDEDSVSREDDFSDIVQPSQETEAEHFQAKKSRQHETPNLNERNEAATSSYKAERKEALKMFLLSVIPEVEEFSDTQIKLFKRKIFSVIDEISGVSYSTNPLQTSTMSSASGL